MSESDESELRKADEAGDAVAARQLGIVYQDRGDIDEAEGAYSRAAERGDLLAMGKLAILIDVHRDDPQAAEAAYRRADDAGSVDGAGNLGRILKERGDLRGAEEAFRRCVDRGSVRALADYAGLLSQRDDATTSEIAEAVAMLCRVEDCAVVSDHERTIDTLAAAGPLMVFSGMWERCAPEAMEAGVRAADDDGSAAGAYHLGLLLRARGELRPSAEASLRAGKRGYVMGWVNAGVALGELGDLTGAEAAARRAEEQGEVKGAALLGSILDQQGDVDGGLEAYRRADAVGDGNGSFNLGIELLNRGELEDAEAALARAEDRGIENAAAARGHVRSQLGLPAADSVERGAGESLWAYGARLERLGDLAGATAAYMEGMNTGIEPDDPLGALRYAEFLDRRHDPAAEAAYQRLAEAQEPAIRAGAWHGIARYRLDRGEIDEGLTALQVIVDTGDPDATPRALRNIGTFREDLGDVEGARAAYRAAIDHDHPKHSQGARVNLAQLLTKEGDHSAAAELFREVMDSAHSAEAPRARVLLGQMLQEQGDDAQALEWYESAIVDENEEWTQRAAFNAGGIYLMQRGDFVRAADAFRIAERIDDLSQSLMASYLRGEAERQRGNEQEALGAYSRVVNADSTSAGLARFAAAKQAGVILLGREDYAGARGLLSLAASTGDPDQSARGFFLLGICERQLGNRQAAIAAFERAAAIRGGPDDVRSRAQQSLLELR